MMYLRTSVGIELRGEDMLIASLQGNFSEGTFTSFTRIPGYAQRNREDLRREIASFFKANGLGKDNVVLGIPREELVLRSLDLPAEVIENLKQVVQYQVQAFEPTEDDRFYHDYTLIPNASAGKRLTVLLAMVRKSALDSLLEFMLELGIRPVLVTGAAIGLSNMFLHHRKAVEDKTFMLADLAPESVELLAFRNGSLAYSRAVAKESDMSWKEAVLKEIDEAASRLRLGPDGAVEKLILAGESSKGARNEIIAAIPDCELIQNFLGLEATGDNVAVIQEAASTIGLAFTGMVRKPAIRMNLTPLERRAHQSRWAYVSAAALGAAVLLLLCALGVHRVVQERMLVRQLDQEIASLKPAVERVQALRRQSEAMEKRIKSTEEFLNQRDLNLEIIRELTTILPPDTYLTTYTYREGTIQLSGSSGSASDLIPKLEKSRLLKDVVTRGTIFKVPQTGKENFSFEAKLER